jgi:hypothetical protein
MRPTCRCVGWCMGIYRGHWCWRYNGETHKVVLHTQPPSVNTQIPRLVKDLACRCTRLLVTACPSGLQAVGRPALCGLSHHQVGPDARQEGAPVASVSRGIAAPARCSLRRDRCIHQLRGSSSWWELHRRQNAEKVQLVEPAEPRNRVFSCNSAGNSTARRLCAGQSTANH